jgi:hypothetical protein
MLRRVRALTALSGVAFIWIPGVTGIALGQTKSPPGGTTPGGAIFDRLHDATTRPLPRVPPPAVPAPDMTWVPDRHVQVPGVELPVLVPGHWELRLSDREVYVPPLIGRTHQGDVINFPAGVRPPVGERQTP